MGQLALPKSSPSSLPISFSPFLGHACLLFSVATFEGWVLTPPCSKGTEVAHCGIFLSEPLATQG